MANVLLNGKDALGGVCAVLVSLRKPKAKEPRHGVEDRGKKAVSVRHQHAQDTRRSVRMQNWAGTQGESYGGLRLLAGTQTHQPTRGEAAMQQRKLQKSLFSPGKRCLIAWRCLLGVPGGRPWNLPAQQGKCEL